MYEVARKYLYGRKFGFQNCSAVGVEAFLANHRKYGHLMTQLDLFYNFRPRRPELDTYGDDWHRMMCEVRHQFCVPLIHIYVRPRFWVISEWRKGPGAVMRQEGFLVGQRYRANFLEDVAKIAAPADRWLGHDYSGAGTEVQIFIDDPESDEQVQFVKELNEEILPLRLERHLFVLGKTHRRDKYECYTRPSERN
jgi:hypothetical protein